MLRTSTQGLLPGTYSFLIIPSLILPGYNMSSNTSMTSNITGGPSAACPDTFGLWGRTPVEWQNSDSANFTDLSCAVPSCNNYPAVLASCCGGEVGDLHQFETEIGPYVSCTLQDAEAKDAYQEYQNCLLRHFVEPFKCNDPDPDSPTVDACDGQVIEPPQVPGPDEQICSLRASPNATRAMISCCSGAGTNGTGITLFDSGCNIACASDSSDMQGCLSEKLNNPTEGGGVTCNSGDNVKEAQDSVDNNTSQSTHIGVQLALVGSASLLAVSVLL
jgi:hypothetical protein